MNHEGAVSGKLLIYWLVTIILPCLVLLLPVNEIMTADLKVFLSITLAAILFSFLSRSTAPLSPYYCR